MEYIKTQNSDLTLKDANSCMAVGAGVGALGLGAALAGAACPVCFVVAPALIGAGLAGRYRAKKLSTGKNK